MQGASELPTKWIGHVASARVPNGLLFFFAAFMAGTTFWIDISLPLGMAGGVPYVAVVLVGWWASDRRAIFALALVASLLIYLGYTFSPTGSPQWMVVTNRLLALFAIWVIAAHVYMVTERAEALNVADAELRDSEAQLRLILDNAADGILAIDERGVVGMFNRAAERIFGYTAEEVVGRNINMLMPEPDRGQHDAYISRYLQTGKAAVIGIGREVTGKHKDGARLDLRLAVGEAVVKSRRLFVGILSDVSAQKRTQKALRESEEQLQAMFNNTPAIIHVKDVNGKYVFANRGMATALNRSENEIVGQTDQALFPPELAAAYRRHDLAAIAEKTVVTDEEVVPQSDGIHTYIVTKYPIFDAHGSVSATCGISVDITERKNVEGELRQREADLRRAQELAQLGSWSWDVVANRERWSDQLYKILGLDPQTAPPSSDAFRASIHPEDLERVRNEIGRTNSAPHAPSESRCRIVQPNGEVRHIHVIREMRCDPDGRPVEMLGVVRDETERQLTDERLRQMQRLEALGQLAGGIAHDCNNMLMPIITITEITKDGLTKGGQLANNLDNVLAAAQRGKRLIAQILAFAQAQPINRQPVDMGVVVREILGLLRSTIPSTVRINEAIELDVGTVLADPAHIHQIVVNLVSNSTAAIGTGTGTITVEVRKIGAGELETEQLAGLDRRPHMCIIVRDTGCGMDQETLSRVFDPFFTKNLLGDGTGLGLAVVHGIVAQHNGAIFAESTPGQGAIFKVMLPLMGSDEVEFSASHTQDEFEPTNWQARN